MRGCRALAVKAGAALVAGLVCVAMGGCGCGRVESFADTGVETLPDVDAGSDPDGAMDTGGDTVVPDGADGDADGGGDTGDTAPADTADDDGAEGDAPGDESPWHGEPELGIAPRTTLGGLMVSVGPSGDPDHPEIFVVEGAEGKHVWVGGRIVNDPTCAPVLAFVRLNPKSGLPTTARWDAYCGTSGYIDRVHPVAPVTGGWVAIATGSTAVESYMQVLTADEDGGAGVPVGTEGDLTSSADLVEEPDLAPGAVGTLAAWRQAEGASVPESRIMYGTYDAAGHSTGTGVASGDGTLDLGQPDLAWNGDGYGLAYFGHMSTAKDRMEFVELDGDGVADAATYRTWPVTLPGGEVVGQPAIAWNGVEYGVAWEEAGSGAARMHFTRVPTGSGTGADTIIDDELEPIVGPTIMDDGQLDLGWNGRWGLVWVHADLSAGVKRAWFVELLEDGMPADDPFVLNTSATNTEFPALVWYETDTQQYWVFAWVEFSASVATHVLLTYSYGCDV